MMNDVVSGSMAYNRFSMQISQSMLFIVDIFENVDDFLLTLDYFDDITIFENEDMQGRVRYFQMKTDESVTINAIIKKEWIHKLYEHIKNDDLSESQISLITTSVVKDNKKKIVESGEKKFNEFSEEIREKFVKVLSEYYDCDASEIDLSNFSIMKTVLTKDAHYIIAEKKVIELLKKINPDISLGTADLTFKSLSTIMNQKQSAEVPKDAGKEDIKKKKSISKKEIKEILDYGNKLTIQEFGVIAKATENVVEDFGKLAIAYANIMGDIRNKAGIFFELIDSAIELKKIFVYDYTLNFSENANNFILLIKNNNLKNIHVISDDFYVEVIAVSLLLRKD